MRPNRFLQADFFTDVIQHCWVGDPPENPRVAQEVKMSDCGNVDFVIADVDEEKKTIREFVSVELQAVDCSGSVEAAYVALVNSQELEKRPRFGINWRNVQKRYVNQLITKGFYHHQWGTRIVSVIQTALYEYLHKNIPFDELPPTADSAN